MNLFRTFMAVAAAGTITLSAADLSQITTAKRWQAYECTLTQSGKSMIVNMPVDHKAGQKAYPIGWPRTYLRKLIPAEKNWTKAKAISFDLKLEFTGKTKKYPLTFHFFWMPKAAKKVQSATLPITNLKNNTVNKVVLPLTRVKDLSAVSGIGFNISESQYKHGENFKFTVSNFKLVSK